MTLFSQINLLKMKEIVQKNLRIKKVVNNTVTNMALSNLESLCALGIILFQIKTR